MITRSEYCYCISLCSGCGKIHIPCRLPDGASTEYNNPWSVLRRVTAYTCVENRWLNFPMRSRNVVKSTSIHEHDQFTLLNVKRLSRETTITRTSCKNKNKKSSLLYMVRSSIGTQKGFKSSSDLYELRKETCSDALSSM